MPDFCLLPKHIDELKERYRTGALDLDALARLSSADRRAALAEIVGDANAQHTNALFESKLLLQNQKKGLETWIKQTTTGKAQRDLLSRVARMDRVLEPGAGDPFLEDLARQKLGFGVTMEEAGKITELSRDVADARTANDWDRYVDARVAFREYTGPLIHPNIAGAGDASAAYVRAGALSWPTTIVKLTSVALSRFVTTPLEDIAALGVRRALPKLAKGAARYDVSGGVAVRAEAAAQAAAWTDGLIDAGRLLQNKASRLDLMFGGDNTVAHKWYEYFGSVHGALKEPIKRAEFARSLYRRTAEAAERGENVKDLGVRLRLSTEAYLDGQRAISMQDNVVTSAWNAGMRRLEQPDKVTGKPSQLGTFLSVALRMDTPVMKAPTNIVIEASDYIGGLLTGSSRAAWEYAHGIEDLKPVERDAIVRQISKGAVGAAVMALYFFKSDNVEMGGFHSTGEKRSASDVPVEAMRVYGQDVPKGLLHNPVFAAANFAASIQRVAERTGSDATGVANATAAAAFGLLSELPILNTAEDAVKLVRDEGSKAGIGAFADKKIASMLVPGVIQWTAKTIDPEPKREPSGLVENLEANLPGLRETVPTHKRKRK